ncbi:hypothetical protein SCUCBS95973_008459 [Sporothrix curviconia]|uniref:Uncharacterized protein n=1 Tax=Sporothrix curviconia TaxID=1260050 RepID=A0ABP0CPC2_9PEZI
MTSLLYFFRHQRILPSVEPNEPLMEETPSPAKELPDSPSSLESSSSPSVDPTASGAMSATSSPPQRQLAEADEGGDNLLLKRKASGPLDSGRTPVFVSKRWKTLNRPMDPGGPSQRAREIRQPASVADRANNKPTWASRLNPMRLVRVKQEMDEEAVANGLIVVARSEYDLKMARLNREIPDSQETVDTEMATDADGEGGELEGKEEEDDGDEGEDEMGDCVSEEEEEEEEEEEDAEDGDDSGLYDPALSAKAYPHPGLPVRVQSFKGSSLDAGIDQPAVVDSDEYDDSDDSLEDEEDGVDENWEWLFEEEESTTLQSSNKQTPVTAPANDYYWSVAEDERTAYENGVAGIEDYQGWTADEKRLHRLLSLRGFHPLLPATWTRDFLGVPMYPSLFSPIDADDAMSMSGEQSTPPVTITNYGSQFHATKALRALFDLQSRVSGLRQTGHNTVRIGAIIERELRRYIAWAATDAGLDQCKPLAVMPNIAAKQFIVQSKDKKNTQNRKGKTTRKRSLARQVQDFFGDWVARYRTYYATLTDYAVDGHPGLKRRLRPPRLLYGFVIVQHAVMLLVVDAAGNRSSRHPRPRCLADFNLSLGDRWLDASLSVAIPVHVARAAQLRCRQGLVLPSTSCANTDEDA